LLGRLLGDGSDYVVRFVALFLQDGQTHRCAQRANVGKLHAHFVGHGLALSFVFLKEFVAKCCARRIKHDSDIFRLIIVDQALENISKEKWNIGRNAARSRQPLRHRRKKCPVHVRHRIHEKQFFRSGRHAREYSKGLRND
jgi:hypothetical protein